MRGVDAPFPWFGGKKAVADRVWIGLGKIDHYVEPFFGSGAVLLRRPHAAGVETVNDADGLLANFWRAVRIDPTAVAAHADWPVNEADLHARHLWLVGRREALTEALMSDPDWCDVQAAGWWVWGLCAWIGSGWCSGNGPWRLIDGRMTDVRKLPHLGDAGRGVNRKLPHLGDAGRGVNRQLPHMGDAGQGVNRQLPHLGNAGQGVEAWFHALADRLRGVRVSCGDWSRVVGSSVLRAGGGVCGVFLDPPYDQGERADVYAMESKVAGAVRAWCLANGSDPALRVVLAGYAGEHDVLEAAGWWVEAWKARGGYGSQGEGRGRDNAVRERLWFSPHCLGGPTDLFGVAA
ncbi:MAG: DNA methyltransferase [Brevundimonas sp.]|nr:MAG: DNA methyltransferase [Brevundimonas sp.]